MAIPWTVAGVLSPSFELQYPRRRRPHRSVAPPAEWTVWARMRRASRDRTDEAQRDGGDGAGRPRADRGASRARLSGDERQGWRLAHPATRADHRLDEAGVDRAVIRRGIRPAHRMRQPREFAARPRSDARPRDRRPRRARRWPRPRHSTTVNRKRSSRVWRRDRRHRTRHRRKQGARARWCRIPCVRFRTFASTAACCCSPWR